MSPPPNAVSATFIPVSYTHLDVYKRQEFMLLHDLGERFHQFLIHALSPKRGLLPGFSVCASLKRQASERSPPTRYAAGCVPKSCRAPKKERKRRCRTVSTHVCGAVHPPPGRSRGVQPPPRLSAGSPSAHTAGGRDDAEERRKFSRYARYGRSATQALCPPKPSEVEMPRVTGRVSAWFGI